MTIDRPEPPRRGRRAGSWPVLRPSLPGPRWVWVPSWPWLLGPAAADGGPRRGDHYRRRRDGRRIGVPGVGLVSAGAIALILSFTTLEWRHRPAAHGDTVTRIDFAELRQNLEHFPAGGKPAASIAYFSWLCWVLLIALIVIGFAANLPSRGSDGLRLTGFFLGLVGAALTYYALSRYAEATHDLFGTSSGALDNADLGIWFALAGYLAAGLGSALGPMSARGS